MFDKMSIAGLARTEDVTIQAGIMAYWHWTLNAGVLPLLSCMAAHRNPC